MTTSITYKSTRGEESGLTFEQVALKGMGKSRGLFVPESIPVFTLAELDQMRSMSYPELAFEVMHRYIKSDEIPSADLRSIITDSFAKFRHTEVTPCMHLSEYWILELFHGPTFSFKDIAQQFLGNLFEYLLARGRYQSEMTILGSSSGDTGSAAIHGLRGKKNIDCFVIFPYGKVTEIQERQMTTVTDDNVHTICVRGDFDDAQELVKQAFMDKTFRTDVHLGAINSINWARILAQIPYFFYAYLRVSAGHKHKGEPINFAVPTGNFGDIFAGYMAKKMGLPIDKLVVCTNQNQVLHKFFRTGKYKRVPVMTTISPSMDIGVSSNLERYLYYLADEDPQTLTSWMEAFETTGELRIPHLLARAQREFLSCAASKQDTIDAIRDEYRAEGYLLCPHTAIAAFAVKKLSLRNTHTVVIATAHYAKFEEALALSLPTEDIPARPVALQELFVLPTKKILLPTAVSEIKKFIASRKRKSATFLTGEIMSTTPLRAPPANEDDDRIIEKNQGKWWPWIAITLAAVVVARYWHQHSH